MHDHFLYLVDPLCGWCYGASAGIRALAGHGTATVEVVPTGLFAAEGARLLDGGMRDHILASDRRIEEMTGACFGAAYRDQVLGQGPIRLDSGPATLALAAAAQSDPASELAALTRIQHARYAEGRDITDLAVLARLLDEAGLAAAALALAAPGAPLHAFNAARLGRARSLMRRFGLGGVPALLRQAGSVLTPLDAAVLFRDPLSLVSPPGAF